MASTPDAARADHMEEPVIMPPDSVSLARHPRRKEVPAMPSVAGPGLTGEMIVAPSING